MEDDMMKMKKRNQEKNQEERKWDGKKSKGLGRQKRK